MEWIHAHRATLFSPTLKMNTANEIAPSNNYRIPMMCEWQMLTSQLFTDTECQTGAGLSRAWPGRTGPGLCHHGTQRASKEPSAGFPTWPRPQPIRLEHRMAARQKSRAKNVREDIRTRPEAWWLRWGSKVFWLGAYLQGKEKNPQFGSYWLFFFLFFKFRNRTTWRDFPPRPSTFRGEHKCVVILGDTVTKEA